MLAQTHQPAAGRLQRHAAARQPPAPSASCANPIDRVTTSITANSPTPELKLGSRRTAILFVPGAITQTILDLHKTSGVTTRLRHGFDKARAHSSSRTVERSRSSNLN